MRTLTALVGAAGLVLAGCTESDPLDVRPEGEGTVAFSAAEATPGGVYVLSNGAADNEVLSFPRHADGSLGSATGYSTGGVGTGAGLGSQGALALSGRWLLAVNAGSDDISVFRIKSNGLQLTDQVASGGDMPISVTIDGDLVYVLNAGGAGSISGFWLSPQGTLSAIAGSTQPLSGAGVGPAQVSFSPDGSMLVVTEKATNLIVTYAVGADGRASAPTSHPSSGMTPFGFAFAGKSTLVVSEAFGGAADASATSSYELSGGTLTPVSSTVATTETAACWAATTRNGRYAYVTNTGSSTVTGYAVSAGGSLTLLDADGATGMTGAGSRPIDAGISSNNYLYVLSAGSNTVSAFRVSSDGGLTPVDTEAGLPAGSVGLAVR